MKSVALLLCHFSVMQCSRCAVMIVMSSTLRKNVYKFVMTTAPLSGDCLRMYLMFLFQAVGVLVQMGALHLTKLPHLTHAQTSLTFTVIQFVYHHVKIFPSFHMMLLLPRLHGQLLFNW